MFHFALALGDVSTSPISMLTMWPMQLSSRTIRRSQNNGGDENPISGIGIALCRPPSECYGCNNMNNDVPQRAIIISLFSSYYDQITRFDPKEICSVNDNARSIF